MWQKRQIQQVLRDFPDVFSDVPGMVQGDEHMILTPPRIVVRAPLSLTLLALREVIEKAVQTMLLLGVI